MHSSVTTMTRGAGAGGVAVIFDKQQLILLEDCQEMMVRVCGRAWCPLHFGCAWQYAGCVCQISKN